MCVICRTRDGVAKTVDCTVHSIAVTHRDQLARQLQDSPYAATALFGEIPDGGSPLQMTLTANVPDTGAVSMDVRLPDGEKGLRITYAPADYTACVAYTGNGPEGKSRIGVDAILAALEYISSKETAFEAMRAVGIKMRDLNVDDELARTQLVKRCLVALREHAENSPAR